VQAADDRGPLVTALGELAALGTDRDREVIAGIRDRLASARLRVLVAGEAKRGKSTLVNALLGADVLPAGVTPLTAIATTVRYSCDPHAEVRFTDGHEEKHPLSALDELVTERGNPRNRRGVASVTAYADAPLLAGGVELVDTPGTDSVFEWDTAAAHKALETMDAAVFVLTADPPVSASERELLGRVAELSVTTFAVLNKADHLDEAGLAEAGEFTQQVLAEALGKPVRLYPMSARAALSDGGDPGFAAFAADFTAYLASRRVADLALSAAAQARRIAGALLDEVALTRRAAQMKAGDAARRVAEFSEKLAEVAIASRDAVSVANGEAGRLLFALNDSAGEAGTRLRTEIGRWLAELLDGELAQAPAGEIERRGREKLVGLTLEKVSAWREQRQEEIEQGLARLDARLTDGLKTELGVLRDSAAELLGLDLAVPEPGGRLSEDRRFFFTTGEDIGQTELLAGAIRRSLPGELGRRRAREHLRREIADLVPRQVGRARGDLQYRLAEATRALAAAVERRYTDATERMQRALRAAAELRQASAGEAGKKEQDLAEREAALRHVLSLLDLVAAPGGDPAAVAGAGQAHGGTSHDTH
jgi:hypothetical protein